MLMAGFLAWIRRFSTYHSSLLSSRTLRGRVPTVFKTCQNSCLPAGRLSFLICMQLYADMMKSYLSYRALCPPTQFFARCRAGGQALFSTLSQIFKYLIITLMSFCGRQILEVTIQQYCKGLFLNSLNLTANAFVSGWLIADVWWFPGNKESFRSPSHGCPTQVPKDEYILQVGIQDVALAELINNYNGSIREHPIICTDLQIRTKFGFWWVGWFWETRCSDFQWRKWNSP